MIMMMIIFLGASSAVEGARDFKVGDHLGWHEPGPNNISYYIQWAQRNRFQIGDSLENHCHNGQKLIVEVISPQHMAILRPAASPAPAEDASSSSELAPSPYYHHHHHGSNASSSTSRFMMIGSAVMALLVTFVVVLVLAP
ncbi:uncharacterized protein DS421_9g256350 [Arachis hypogaea]|nr:uncharacterized protein DS421_9g256350 [Arachis hypogaea]